VVKGKGLMQKPSSQQNKLEARLNDFDPARRSAALDELIAMVAAGEISLPPESDHFNAHCHTFFSYNAYGYSPTALAWLGKSSGFKLVGIVDFDVLDAVDEFLDACDRLGLRGSAGLETRIYLSEFSTREITSPGEPGVTYHMGIGFTTSKVPRQAAAALSDLAARADQRNRSMVARLNAYLDPVCVDYERDVLPLTPGGNATERHMLVAYTQAAERSVSDLDSFWAEKLGMPVERVTALRRDTPAFHNMVRAKLMKRGGVGYVQPDAGMFPDIETVNAMIVACDALPCATWLDGTAQGEQDIEELLELQISKGVVTLNIVPDRNWNIPDPEMRKVKIDNLYHVVALAQALDLPVNVGTEMNSYGQKLVDDFDAPELGPVRQVFMQGADFIYGHTALQRILGLGYLSPWAVAHFPTRRDRNAFYQGVGAALPPGNPGKALLQQLSQNPDPNDIRALLHQQT
jgi:hypothetical protein